MNEMGEESDEEIFSDLALLNDKCSEGESLRLSRITIYHSACDLMPSEEEDKRIVRRSVGFCGLPPRMHYSKRRYFRDGTRTIDLVLSWAVDRDLSVREMNRVRRGNFEKRLVNDGLELELETIGSTLRLVKIHAPTTLLAAYCDVLKLRMPLKEAPVDVFWKKVKIAEPASMGDHSTRLPAVPSVRGFLTAPYCQKKSYLFFDDKDERFFTPLIRSVVVNYILERANVRIVSSGKTDDSFQKLLKEGVYKAVYPLHDGGLDDTKCLRGRLKKDWASFRKIFNAQPIDHIKEYCGAKVALYFAWFGFYTIALVPAAVVGSIVFLYGCFTAQSDSLSSDICDPIGHIMCPRCQGCGYWRINELCAQGKLRYAIDNPAMIIFASFMSIWAAICLKLWKRYSASIVHRWSLNGYSPPCEPYRPQYATQLAKEKGKVAVGVDKEPAPFWKVLDTQIFLGLSLILFMLFLVLVAFLSFTFYRISIIVAVSIMGPQMNYMRTGTLVIAALFNLFFVLISNYFYRQCALRLTELERRSRQTEFDDSLMVKICIIQFLNFFTSAYVIAFVKGKFASRPWNDGEILPVLFEKCNGPGGCMFELIVHISATLLAYQALNLFVEVIAPMIAKSLKAFKARKLTSDKFLKNRESDTWPEDYKLLNFSRRRISWQYSFVVVQYGFIALFASAFTLAPLFALINNVLRLRLNARNLLTYYRRPLPVMTVDMGIWSKVLSALSSLAIFSNGLIIAFTSNIIPQLVYNYSEKSEVNSGGFLNASLGVFNPTGFLPGTVPPISSWNVTTCRFPSFVDDDTSFWHVLAARLLFVVLFQALVSLTVTLVAWWVPDISPVVFERMKIEEFLANELMVERENERARSRNSSALSYVK